MNTTDTAWMLDGLCAQTDPELFFPEKGGENNHRARSICAQCPVLALCYDYALNDSSLDGVWGGTTPRQRQTVRRRRAQAENGSGTWLTERAA